MNATALRVMARRHRVAIVVLALAAVAAAVFRRPLVAWFTGEPMTSGRTSSPVEAQAGPLAIEASIEPDPPRQKGNALHLTIAARDGSPVAGAEVRVQYVMPAMGAMAEMRGAADVADRGGGRFEARFDLPMAGSWTLEVSVKSAEASGTARFSVTVGSSGLRAVGASGEGQAAKPADPAPPALPAGAVSHEGHGHRGDDVGFYTCAMHPAVEKKEPGKCPICAMELSPVTYEETESGVVRVDQERRQRIGLKTATVHRAPMTIAIRAVGRLTYDETRLKDVTLKVKGWIARLKVNSTGQPVKKGETLLTLYSPDLYAAQQEYLLALASQKTAGPTGAAGRSDYLVKAAEKKLQLWDLTPSQIAAIARRGEPIEELPILSPASGFVIEKDVVEGAAVEPGQRLFRIAALDRVWIDAQVYEMDLAQVKKGQVAKVSLPYQAGETLEGKVAYVYPYLDPMSRTGRVRIELPNKDLAFKPDMYANVELSVDLGPRLQVPIDSVVYTGPRRLVFIDVGEDRIRPQEVTLGLRNADMVEITSGLSDGQVIVTAANFLIAAESRIRSAGSLRADDAATGSPAPAPAPQGGAGHAGH